MKYSVTYFSHTIGEFDTFAEARAVLVQGVLHGKPFGAYQIFNNDRCDSDGPGLTDEEEEELREL